MAVKEIEPKETDLMIETIGGEEFVIPEYNKDFFERDWSVIVREYVQSLFMQEYKKRLDAGEDNRSIRKLKNRKFRVGKVNYQAEEVNREFCRFISDDPNWPMLLDFYGWKERSVDLFFRGRRGEDKNLTNRGINRDELYIFGEDEKRDTVVISQGSSKIIVPKVGWQIPIQKAENYDCMLLSYNYDYKGEVKLPKQVVFGLENSKVFVENYGFDRDGKFESGYVKYSEDMISFGVKEGEVGVLIASMEESGNRVISPELEQLIRVMCLSVSGKGLVFEATGR